MAEKRTTWRARLERFAEHYRKFHSEAKAQIDQMPIAEVRKLLEATQKPTETNCGWCTFECAPLIAKLCRQRLYAAELIKKRGQAK